MCKLTNDLLEAARQYKWYVASRYRLLKPEDLGRLEGEVFASVKQDGQFHLLYKKGEDCFLFNPKGRVLDDLPLLDDARMALDGMAGELYCPNSDGRSRVYDVTKALGQDGKKTGLVFGVFDVLRLNDENRIRESYGDLVAWITDHLPSSGRFHGIAFTKIAGNQVAGLFAEQVIERGHEGLVCTSDTTGQVYKIKPRHHVDAVVIGFTHEAGAVRVLLTALMRPDGSFQTFARVGTGFDEMQRRELYRMLAPLQAASNYNKTDRNHTLFTMVQPKHVIEVAFHDVLTESASGKPQMKAVLCLEDGRWKAKVPERFVNVLFPVFARLRSDKSVNPTDLRLTQVAAFVDLDNLETSSKSVHLPQSEIMDQEVYVKGTKGGTAVRKLVTWKTNKEQMDPNYPAYVFCYVDYSPNRAQTLKRTLRAANTIEGAKAHIARFRECEIKRGWEAARPVNPGL